MAELSFLWVNYHDFMMHVKLFIRVRYVWQTSHRSQVHTVFPSFLATSHTRVCSSYTLFAVEPLEKTSISEVRTHVCVSLHSSMIHHTGHFDHIWHFDVQNKLIYSLSYILHKELYAIKVRKMWSWCV